MLKTLKLKNFTVFKSATFEFGRHLNLIVGENGTGKSHVLKAGYCGIAANAQNGQPDVAAKLSEKMMGVFRPDALGRLVRRRQGQGSALLELGFADAEFDCSVSLSTQSKLSLKHAPAAKHAKKPVFLPTRELMTLGLPFVSIYETTYLPFEETWRDTCVLLGAPVLRGPRAAQIGSLMDEIEAVLGGKVEADETGRFYLALSTGRMEMHLVAEGMRKLAMLARLIASGSLLDKSYLFWDEPEANLNPKVIKVVAKVIIGLAQAGVQVFVATHSLFLMRELYVLGLQDSYKQMDVRCFGLHSHREGYVEVSQGKNISEIGDITALDEELLQADAYIEAEMGIA